MKKMVNDNPKDNVEIMLNLAYGKDGEVWIRGGSEEGKDCTLVDFAKRTCKACKCYLADDAAEQDIDGLGDFLMDCSMNCCPIGTYYYIAIQAAELRGRLRLYEDFFRREMSEPLHEAAKMFRRTRDGEKK